jgi:hypothetical protein
MKRFLSMFQSEKGSVLVVAALAMVVILGATALVVDVGRVYSERSSLQKALDAAVLGGAQVLRTSTTQAVLVAKEISSKNSYSLEDNQFITTSDSIKVSSEAVVPMTFAKVLGINSFTVPATAKAVVAPLQTGRGITPIAVERSAIPDGRELKCDNTGQDNGNCGYLAVDGNGANELAEGILNGTEVTVGTGYPAVTEPGQKWGPVKSAFQELIDRDADKPHCQSPDTADNRCSRVIYVAVIDSWDDAQGKDTIPVVDLAAYWVEEVSEPKRIIGQFIRTVSAGDIGGVGSDFSLYGVKLVE